MRQFLLLIFLVAGAAFPARSQNHAGGLDWIGYRNQRFGLVLRYPAHVFKFERAAAAGDGELFSSQDGRAQLLIGAFENTDHHSPESYQKFIARQSYSGLKIDYAPVGRSWSVISGVRGDTMIYEKVMFSCGGRVINSFAMTYPVAERRLYDPIVEGIEDSFSPGTEGCSQHATARP